MSLDDCILPQLEEPYDTALAEAVRYIVQEFDPIGIVAAGSILRGEGYPSSDLDIFVIHTKPERQMIQTFFGGVPAQIFLNPPHMVERYFETEAQASECTTAHMLGTGFVVLNRDPVIDRLRTEAQRVLQTPPHVPEHQLIAARYHTASELENAFDVADVDAASAVMMAGQAVYKMLQFYFRANGQYIPRDKDLLKRIAEQNAELGALAREFYGSAPDVADSADARRKLQVAAEIADRTIQARGFFEWATPRETV